MKSIIFCMVLCLTIRNCCLSRLHFDHLKQCHREYHSCSSGSKNIYCRCDELCLYYDDCCFDAEVRPEANKELDMEHRTFLNTTTCELNRRDPESYPGAFMVSACPGLSSIPVDVRIKCEQRDNNNNVQDILPVTAIGTNITFANRYCARCHGIHEWIPWLLDIRCGYSFYAFSRFPFSMSLNEVLELQLNSQRCTHSFEPPQYSIIRNCFQQFNYNILNVMGEKTTCDNRIFMPIRYTKMTLNNITTEYYRTTQCLLSGGNPIYSNMSWNVNCYVLHVDNTGKKRDPYTLGTLIDLSTLLHPSSNVAECGETEIYLSEKIGCQPLYCPNNWEPFEGKCGDVQYETKGKLLDVLFEVDMANPRRVHVVTMFGGVVETIFKQLNKSCSSHYIFQRGILYFSGLEVITGTHIFSGHACSVVILRYPFTPTSLNNCTIDDEREVVADLLINYNMTLAYGVSFHHANDVTNLSCMCNFSFNNPTYIMTQFVSENSLPCAAVKVRFQENETGLTDFNRSMLNNATKEGSSFDLDGTIIDSTDVVFSNGEYFLCVDTFLSKYQINTRQDSVHYRTIINAVCTCISIICLVYCLVQFCVVPFMRNGKLDLVLVLIIFLLIAQVCFFVMSVFTITDEYCEWLGLIHHFAWLGTFVLMFLCSFRLNREIRNLKTYSRSENTLITVKYTCVGLAIIVVIVLTTKIMNLYLAPTEKWYGGSVCFISQVLVLLFSFVIPIGLILCGNIVVFVCIIHYIYTTSISNTLKTVKPKLVLFVKISTLMGFSWILGIIAVLVESEVLMIIFENIASLQGMFITFSFACNHRSWKYCKVMLRENRADSEAKPSSHQGYDHLRSLHKRRLQWNRDRLQSCFEPVFLPHQQDGTYGDFSFAMTYSGNVESEGERNPGYRGCG